MWMEAGSSWSIVAGEQGEQVVAQFQSIHLGDQAAESSVHLRDVAPVGGMTRITGRMKLREFWVGGDGFVGFVVADEQEKRFLLVSLGA